jgi:hypothetical protein
MAVGAWLPYGKIPDSHSEGIRFNTQLDMSMNFNAHRCKPLPLPKFRIWKNGLYLVFSDVLLSVQFKVLVST